MVLESEYEAEEKEDQLVGGRSKIISYNIVILFA